MINKTKLGYYVGIFTLFFSLAFGYIHVAQESMKLNKYIPVEKRMTVQYQTSFLPKFSYAQKSRVSNFYTPTTLMNAINGKDDFGSTLKDNKFTKELAQNSLISIISRIDINNKPLLPYVALPFVLSIGVLLLDPSVVSAVEESSPQSWISPTRSLVGIFLNVSSLAFLCRIVLSWYPQVNLNKFPTNVLSWPTEPFLKATRTLVPPAFGVDVSPIIWVAFLSFLNEILVSNQGILTILENK